jgi:hypothetical protein
MSAGERRAVETAAEAIASVLRLAEESEPETSQRSEIDLEHRQPE